MRSIVVRRRSLAISILRAPILALALAAPLAGRASPPPLETPAGYVLQGRLTDSNGDAITSSNVGIVIDIYSPDGTCLLYEEAQTGIDLSQSNGDFAVIFGSEVGGPKRTANDPALALTAIFANTGTQLLAPGANCPSGYTPQPGDERGIRLSVVNGAAPVILSPDQAIAAVPYATVAETLQGSPPSAFVAAGATAGTAALVKNSTPPFACTSSHDSTIALTHLYTICVCNGGSGSWVQTNDGTTACSW